MWVKISGNKKNATESIPKTNYGKWKKKKIIMQRVNAAPRKIIIKKVYKCNQNSAVCFVWDLCKYSKFNNKRSFSWEIFSDLETTFYCKLPRKK